MIQIRRICPLPKQHVLAHRTISNLEKKQLGLLDMSALSLDDHSPESEKLGAGLGLGQLRVPSPATPGTPGCMFSLISTKED